MKINEKFSLPKETADVLNNCRGIVMPRSRAEFIELALGGANSFDVTYEANGKTVPEAHVVRCKNGVAVNFSEDHMRRRDPDCLVVADNLPTNQPRYEAVFGEKFDALRKQTFEWLKTQELIVTAIMAGGPEYGYEAMLVAPKNAAFFALALADLQYFINPDNFHGRIKPKAIIYLAPPFRHSHFKGKQIVVHNRSSSDSGVYEMFSYNLYPGPSAKKGIYGFLLEIGEKQGWITAHASSAKIVTPYENEIIIMHEGASGGGKSEMREPIHRQSDGKILVAQNMVTGEKDIISLDETCELHPISDDVTMCHSKIQGNSKKLVIKDGEDGWFLRVDQISQYGTEPGLERLTIHPPEPLVFLNIQGVEGATCLIWEHTLDSNGKPCPNPRLILPRRFERATIDTPVEVDVRSFGVRTPPCTKDKPSYGIIGMLHVLPPAIAWLWRLVAPRGHANPSITESTKDTLVSEGIGSYFPFLTGDIVKHANMILEQILNTPSTRYVLIPNQHIGCYKVGFMPQWIAREYIARRGGIRFQPNHLYQARCPLLGFGLESLKVDGQFMRQGLLRPELQSAVGPAAYDAGAKMLNDFFKKELTKYMTPALHPTGRKIIELCLRDAPLQDYIDIIPMRY